MREMVKEQRIGYNAPLTKQAMLVEHQAVISSV
jgi:hypothetical protein